MLDFEHCRSQGQDFELLYSDVVGCVCTVPDRFLISHALTLDIVIRYNFVPAIRYSFVPARKEEQFFTGTAPKVYHYSVNAREKEHFCIGSNVILYSVNAAVDFKM